MMIINAAVTIIVNSEHVTKITISDKDDAVLIMAGLAGAESPVTLGRYQDLAEARENMLNLFTALYSGAAYYEMPQSKRFCGEVMKKDARSRRKGGS